MFNGEIVPIIFWFSLFIKFLRKSHRRKSANTVGGPYLSEFFCAPYRTLSYRTVPQHTVYRSKSAKNATFLSKLLAFLTLIFPIARRKFGNKRTPYCIFKILIYHNRHINQNLIHENTSKSLMLVFLNLMHDVMVTVVRKNSYKLNEK